MVNYPINIDTDNELYLVTDRAKSQLSSPITAGDTIITVADTSKFPPISNVVLTIEDENILAVVASPTTFTAITRGFNGTVAVAHSAGIFVKENVVSVPHNALKDAVIALQNKVGVNNSGVATSNDFRISTLEANGQFTVLERNDVLAHLANITNPHLTTLEQSRLIDNNILGSINFNNFQQQNFTFETVQTSAAPIGSPGRVVFDTVNGDRLHLDTGSAWKRILVEGDGAGPGGPIQFTDLTDTPNTYFGSSGQFVRVNVGETGLEFTSVNAQIDIGDNVGSSTVGSVLFVGAGNLLAEDNTNLFWDDTNNILGINTNTPQQDAALEVSSGVGGTKKGFMPPKLTTAQMIGNMSAFANVDGLIGYNTTDSKPFYVDETTPTQPSWYSYESATLAFGRNGNSSGVYLRYGGNATNAGTGWIAPHVGEIKEVTAIETGGNPTKAIDIIVYNAVGVIQSTTTINLAGSTYSNKNENIAFNEGWRVNVFVQGVGAPASNVAVTLQAKWKKVIII